jgi:hypothetical protein
MCGEGKRKSVKGGDGEEGKEERVAGKRRKRKRKKEVLFVCVRDCMLRI